MIAALKVGDANASQSDRQTQIKVWYCGLWYGDDDSYEAISATYSDSWRSPNENGGDSFLSHALKM